jgi:hypothetical protein
MSASLSGDDSDGDDSSQRGGAGPDRAAADPLRDLTRGYPRGVCKYFIDIRYGTSALQTGQDHEPPEGEGELDG